MRKLIFGFITSLVAINVACAANDLTTDTSDPLFMQSRTGLLSQTRLDYFDNGLRIGQSLSYGLADRFVFGGNVHYQQDFDGHQDGFSSIDLGGVYRMGLASENNRRIISDMLFGLKFGGSERVREPDYADSTYYVGLRFGRQYEGVTLAATIKSSWIFKDAPLGMAFIDIMPEVYFRVNPNWRVGANFALRKATNQNFDEETIGFKVVRQYGRTQYAGHFDYAFESESIATGVMVNILF
jgi:hypothetical protein